MEINLQKILKTFDSTFIIARKYYSILFELNDLNITNKELDLVAFTALNGDIADLDLRNQFMDQFKIPANSVYNMISKLKKLSVFIKEKGTITINPTILPDFSKPDLVLVIKLNKNGN